MIDIHSHILPGIDDGARNFEDSLAIAKKLKSQGVTNVIATPHYVKDSSYRSSYAKNYQLLQELRQKLAAAGVGINVHLGNEIYIDSDIKNLLRTGEITGLVGSKYLLIELPLSGNYPNYEEIFLDLINSGFRVILAHPERYASMQSDFGALIRLYQKGVLLQCNTDSFLGKYGKKAKKLAKKLAKEKMIFALGSDIHRARSDKNNILAALAKLRKYYTVSELTKILIENPKTLANRGN